LLRNKTSTMKKFALLLGLSCIYSFGQSQNENRLTIQPFIISTDLLTPVNIAVEQVFFKRLAIKERYHQLIIFHEVSPYQRLYNTSKLLEVKCYFKNVSEDAINGYISVSTKWRNTVVKIEDYSAPKGRIDYRKNTILGFNAGAAMISKTPIGAISFDGSFGFGMSLPYYSSNALFKWGIRFNIGVGYCLYHKPKKH
jgi:hypothetical protein